jgi:hypothetical protein
MKKLIFILFTFVLFNSCTRKDVDVEIFEKDCKDFKISNVSYSLIADPSCGNGTFGDLQITFQFDGEDKCLNKILTYPTFYDANNNPIGNIIYSDTLLKKMGEIEVIGNIATFHFSFNFASINDATNFNSLQLVFETQNEIGNPSNRLELRINPSCSQPGPTNPPKATIPVNSKTINVRLWDHAAEDGDIISINLNGKWVLENYMITNAGQTFQFQIENGSNNMIFYAINQGKSGPNTLSISVNNGTEIQMNPNLLTGESVNIVF